MKRLLLCSRQICLKNKQSSSRLKDIFLAKNSTKSLISKIFLLLTMYTSLNIGLYSISRHSKKTHHQKKVLHEVIPSFHLYQYQKKSLVSGVTSWSPMKGDKHFHVRTPNQKKLLYSGQLTSLEEILCDKMAVPEVNYIEGFQKTNPLRFLVGRVCSKLGTFSEN